jgi:hypothetical protein
VVTQDCDLDKTNLTDNDPCIELRPIYINDPPNDWGIRSEKFKLFEKDYIESSSPRLMVSALLLTNVMKKQANLEELPEDRRIALKTWLGLRYDRPAVPDHHIDLARQISDKVSKTGKTVSHEAIRDVLMQFSDETTPPKYSLFVVMDNDKDKEKIREWLVQLTLDIPSNLGILSEIEVETPQKISFNVIENSYAADVSLLTWPRNRK